ncbi:hypothetical protein [Lacinutrix sp. 5H-3-7-4]|uniref:hypothetical protein n=1 Tax=Lacinutrix sp. (strain 5H-3-7-4) TaxID=983544 RepID=UPI00020A3E78|nr:hypothetical protein [Lacinutrix sp. 5H-3-7-4]AEH02508.1 hypothetical protein Lacal_2668 [Lacinutrix sp. 5H-3-7-4]
MKCLQLKNIFLVIVLAVTYSSQSQSNTNLLDVSQLNGMKSKAAYVTLEQNNFGNSKTFQEDDVTYKLWYNSVSGQCIKTYSKNFYIARVENSTSCKGKNTSANNPYNISELSKMKSKAGYTTLEQNGFGNTKTFQEGNVTYKLWYNSKTGQCVKTYSRNFYIVKVENSNNCGGNTNTGLGSIDNLNNNTVSTTSTPTISTTQTNTTTVTSVNNSFSISDISGMKSKAAYVTLEQNGYANSKTFQEGNVTYKLWYNSKTGECLKTFSRNFYIVKTENSNNCNNTNVYNSKYKGLKSKAVYTSIEQSGFGNTKTFQDRNVTYKLWYNSKTDECIKTFSKNYYIAKVEISNSCK